jgi:hypothetical protein
MGARDSAPVGQLDAITLPFLEKPGHHEDMTLSHGSGAARRTSRSRRLGSTTGTRTTRLGRLGLATLISTLTALALPVVGLGLTGAGAAPAPTVPAAPTIGTATAGVNEDTITWTVGVNGGAPITAFAFTVYSGGVASGTSTESAGAVGSNLDPTPGASDSFVVTGAALAPASFSVASTNSVGTGPTSAQSNVVTATSPPSPGMLTASTTSLDFSQVTLGDFDGPLPVTLTNSGGTTDTITDLELNGVGSDDYTETDDCNTPIAPAGSCTVNVSFNPGALGERPATMTVDDTAHSGISVSFTGEGTIGYYQYGQAGEIGTFGDAGNYGDLSQLNLEKPIVGFASTGDDGGYWFVGSDGGIFAFGDATFYGSTGGIHLNQPIVGMAVTPDGGGYWLVASDGGIFSFGDAQFYGSTGAIHLNQPIVGMATTPDGGGYWLVASDGGIFSFGDAPFYGSTGAIHLNQPIVGMATTPDGGGYWMVASDGGIFSFGDAPFLGSTGAIHLNEPIVGMAAMPDGLGYWLSASDGGVFSFGDAPFLGSVAAQGDGITDVAGIAIDGAPTFQAEADIPAARSGHSSHFVTGQGKRFAGAASSRTPSTWGTRPA